MSNARQFDKSVSPFTRAFPYIFIAVIFGLPVALGLSWMPQPVGPFTQLGFPEGVPHTPKLPPALDTFSFPHLDWPWRIVERTAISNGEFPFWNPFSFLGLPFLAQYQNQILFPLEWLEIAAGPFVWSLLVPAKALLAAAGINQLLKSFHISPPARICSAILYSTSSYFTFFYTVPAFINGAALLPWLLFCAANIISSERPIFWTSTAALFFALMWLTGQPQLALLSVLGCLVFSISLCLQGRTAPYLSHANLEFILKRIFFLGISLALGLSIASPQISSIAELIFSENGYSFHYDGAYAAYKYCYTDLKRIFLPLSDVNISKGKNIPGYCLTYFEWFPFYFGVVQYYILMLIVFHLDIIAASRRNNALLYSTLFSILIFTVWLLLLLFNEISPSHLPILGRVNFARYCPPLLACFSAILCGIAIHNTSLFNRSRVILASGTALLTIAAALTLAWFLPVMSHAAATSDGIYDFLISASGEPGVVTGKDIRTGLWLSLPGPIAAATVAALLLRIGKSVSLADGIGVAIALNIAAETSMFVRYGLASETDAYRVLVALVFVVASLVHGAGARLPAYAALTIFGGLTAVIIGTSKYHLAAQARWDIDPPSYIRFLQEKLGHNSRNGRLLNTYPGGYALPPNVASAFGIAQFNGLAPVNIGTTSRLLLEVLPPAGAVYYGGLPMAWRGISNPREDPIRKAQVIYPVWSDYAARRAIYNFFGVRFLMDLKSGELVRSVGELGDLHTFLEPKINHPGWRKAASKSDMTIVIAEDKQALPRAFVLKCVHLADDLDGAIATMRKSTFDPRTCAVIEAGAPGTDSAIRQIGNAPASFVDAATITHIGLNRVDIALAGNHSGLLVLTDSYYPGWQASADGEKIPILRVDGVVRGVLIDPDTRHVTFTYCPTYMTASIIASGTAIFIVVVMLLWPQMSRRKKRGAELLTSR